MYIAFKNIYKKNYLIKKIKMSNINTNYNQA